MNKPNKDLEYGWDWDKYDYEDPTDRECEVCCKEDFDFSKRYDPKNLGEYDGETAGFLWDHCSFLNHDGETYVMSPEQAEAVIAYAPVYQITDCTGHIHSNIKKNGKPLPPKTSGKLFKNGEVANISYEKVGDRDYRVFVEECLMEDALPVELLEAKEKDPEEKADIVELKSQVKDALDAIEAPEGEDEYTVKDLIDAVLAYFDDEESIDYIRSVICPESTEDKEDDEDGVEDIFNEEDIDIEEEDAE